MANLILEDLHATREKLLNEAGGDLHRYVEEARKRALASGRAIAHPTRREGQPKISPNFNVPASEGPSSPHRNP
ncbi:MAG: hypothetical protein ABL999_03140 [Pyrinomonadaceae bacterium]